MAREYNIYPVATEHACSANLVLSGRTFCVRQKDVNEMIRHPASRRQNIDLSGNPVPPRMTAAREGLGRVRDSVQLQPERSITFLLRSKKRAAQQSVNG